MRVLVACERSGVVREAFRRRGHEAWSCDLVPADDASPFHIQQDAVQVAYGQSWDLMVAHPPCTFLCSMGVWWNKKRPERIVQMEAAIEFVRVLLGAPIGRIALENPVGILSKRIGRPSQIIVPCDFGHEVSKKTCLWLKKLPPLFPTRIVSEGEFYVKKNGNRLAVWCHKESGTNKVKRAHIASKTFLGIADAMADQWGSL